MKYDKMTTKSLCIYQAGNIDSSISATIVYEWFIDTHTNHTVFDYMNSNTVSTHFSSHDKEDKHSLTLLKWSPGDITPDMNYYDNVIILGTTLPVSILSHSPSGTFSTSALTWRLLFPKKEIPEIVKLSDNYRRLYTLDEYERQRTMLFQYAALARIHDYKSGYSHLAHDSEELIDSILKEGKVIHNYLEAKVL